MHPTLTKIHNEFASRLSGLNTSQTQLRPRGRVDAWTMQQIVEHLLLTYDLTCKAMEERLAKGTPTSARPTWNNRLTQFGITRLGLFPHGRPAPQPVQPATNTAALDGPRLSAAMAEHLETMSARLNEVETRFGPGRTVNHMLLGPMSIAQWRRFHLSHARHHLKQIIAIRGQF